MTITSATLSGAKLVGRKLLWLAFVAVVAATILAALGFLVKLVFT